MLLMMFFWELTACRPCLLIGYWSHSTDARKGARMALAVTACGLALLRACCCSVRIVGSTSDRTCWRGRI